MSDLNHSRTVAARFFAAALLLGGAGSVLAGVHYVDLNSTNATPPYTNWTTAGTDPTNRFSSPAQLTITRSATNVILTWPTNAVGFTLQSTTNLGSPAVWSTHSPAPVVIGGQNVVTNPISSAQKFYRLIQ